MRRHRQRFDDASAIPDGVQDWFKALPAYNAAVEAITPLREAALVAAEALNDAAEEHAAALRKAVREAEDAPKPDPIDINPAITIEPPEPMFHTLEEFLNSTRKLIARRDGSALPSPTLPAGLFNEEA